MKSVDVLVLNQDDVGQASLDNYEFVVDQVKLGLMSRFHGITRSDKVAIDLSYGHKFDSLVSIDGDFVTNKWLGANIANSLNGELRSYPMIIVNDKITGRPVSIMDGTLISSLRTGAYAALACEYFLKGDSNTLVFIGSGVVAKAAAACIASHPKSSEKVSKILAYSRNPLHSEQFASMCGDNLPSHISFESLPTRQDLTQALLDADLSASLHTSKEMYIGMDTVNPSSVHVHIGGQDDEFDFIQHCAKNGKIIVDDWKLIQKRNIQMLAFAKNHGIISDDDIYAPLGAIVSGVAQARESNEPIFFNAVGLPELDMYVASNIYRNAVALGLGKKVEIIPSHSHWITQ